MDLKERPPAFRPYSRKLSAEALNNLRLAVQRQITGGGGSSVQKYGDRVVVQSQDRFIKDEPQVKEFVVLEDEPNYYDTRTGQYSYGNVTGGTITSTTVQASPVLRCVPFHFAFPQPADSTLGADTPEYQVVYVAKPYMLQDAIYPDLMVPIEPQYEAGEIISARMGLTGYYALTLDNELNFVQVPVSWMDVNTAGRHRMFWAVLTNYFNDTIGGYTYKEVFPSGVPGQWGVLPNGRTFDSIGYRAFPLRANAEVQLGAIVRMWYDGNRTALIFAYDPEDSRKIINLQTSIGYIWAKIKGKHFSTEDDPYNPGTADTHGYTWVEQEEVVSTSMTVQEGPPGSTLRGRFRDKEGGRTDASTGMLAIPTDLSQSVPEGTIVQLWPSFNQDPLIRCFHFLHYNGTKPTKNFDVLTYYNCNTTTRTVSTKKRTLRIIDGEIVDVGPET